MGYSFHFTLLLKKNHLTNLSILPYPITQTWEFSIPIPHWILHFFHIEGGLLITINVTISAHRETEENNSFILEVTFRQRSERSLPPHTIEELTIVFRYLWPNQYYKIEEDLIICTPSRGSSSTGSTTLVDPLSLELTEVPLPLSPIPEIPNIPGIADFNR